jgi:hypothetical protein
MNAEAPITGWSALMDPPPADERFWADLRRRLAEVSSERATAGDSAGGGADVAPTPVPPRRRAAGRRMAIAAVAAVIIALAVVAIGLLTGRTPDTIGPVPADETPDPTEPTTDPTESTVEPTEPTVLTGPIGLDGLADVVPESTFWLSFVDVAAMRASAGVEAAELAERIGDAAPLPVDEVSNIEGAIRTSIFPFRQPFDNTHADVLDLRSIDFIATVELPETFTLITTNQDPDQLAAAYEAGGFDPVGVDRLLHPVGPASGGTSGGSPAVQLNSGRLVLAPFVDNLDAFAGDDVGDTPIRTLLEAATGARAGSVLVPGDDGGAAQGCAYPYALISSDVGFELLLLDAGTDSLDPERLRGLFESLPVGLDTIGPGQVDGDVTRYQYVPAEPDGMPVLGSPDVLWTTIAPDAPPLSPCPS